MDSDTKIRIPLTGSSAFLRRHTPTLAFGLLVLWCLLPVMMALFAFFGGWTGIFPDEETLLAQGFTLGYTNYVVYLEIYALAFRLLGLLTIFLALWAIVANWTDISSRIALRKQPWYYLLAALLLWTIFSSLFSDSFARAFIGGHYRFDGLSSFFIYGAVFVCASLLTEEQHRRVLIRLFTIVICLLSVLMLIQDATDSDFLNYCFPSHDATVFNQFNHFGYMLCMAANTAAGLFLWDKSTGRIGKGAYLLAFILLIYTLLVNDTFGAFLAALAGLIFIYILFISVEGKPRATQWLPALLFVALSGIAVAGLLPLADGLRTDLLTSFTDINNIAAGNEAAMSAGTGRMQLWLDTLERIAERPIFGYGPEGFYDQNAITGNTATHNEYLQMAGLSGIPALLLYLAALVTLLLAQWKRRKQLSFWILIAIGTTVTYLVSACFGNPMYNTAPYFWLFLGLSAGTVSSQKPLLCPAPIRENPPRRGLSPSAGIALLTVFLLSLICVFSFILSMRNEKNRELADLEGIQCAVLAAQSVIDEGSLSEYTEYYYDPENFCLIRVGDGLPEGTGLGTDLDAHIAEEFAAVYGTDYSYSGRQSYYNQIILLSIDPANNNAVNISWISLPSE